MFVKIKSERMKIGIITTIILGISTFVYINSPQVAKTAAISQVAIASSEESNFNKYWYAGEAELNSYTLSQARYGENHEGEAVLIFVTEDFSKSKYVV